MFGMVDFTIEDGTVTDMELSYSFTCPIPGTTISGNMSGNPPVEVTDGQFTLPFMVGRGSAGTINGTIMSETSIVGTVTIPVITGCTTEEIQLRWTATPV